MKVNLSISPLANVLALINGANGSAIDESQVTASGVSTATGHSGENSQITLTGIDGMGIEGERTFYYNRYNLLGAKEPDPTRVEILATDDQTQIRAKVTTAYGLDPDEVVVNSGSDITIPSSGNDVTFTTMAANDGSLLYVGNPITVNVTLAGTTIPLDKAIPVTTFEAFTGYAIDIAKTPVQNLFDIVNAVYPWGFTSSTLTTSLLGAYTPTDPDTSNTTITLTAVGGQGFSGTREIHYHRVDVLTQITPQPDNVVVLEADTDTQVKAKVAAALNLIVGSITVASIVRPTAGVPGSCTVRGAGSSVLYTTDIHTIVLVLG